MTERQWLSPGELADVLASGKYPKGRSYLVRVSEDGSDVDGYCCLGVLACEAGYKPVELLGLQFLLPTDDANSLNDGPSWLAEIRETHPDLVEIGNSPGTYWTGNLQEHLAELNDDVEDWGPVVEELRRIQGEIE